MRNIKPLKLVLSNAVILATLLASFTGLAQQNISFLPAIQLLLLGEESPWKLTKIKTFDDIYTSHTEVYNNRLYFSAAGLNSFSDYEVWSTDGTESGTFLTANINSAGPSFPRYFTLLDDKLCFAAQDNGVTHRELWCGKPNLVSLLHVTKAANPNGAGEPSPTNSEKFPVIYDPAGSKLYFRADNSTVGVELWNNNGTTTQLETDNINPGSFSSNPQLLTVVPTGASGAKLMFVAKDAVGDRELWQTVGTTTTKVANISSAPSNPGELTVVKTLAGAAIPDQYKLFFSAESLGIGRELWVHDPNAASNQTQLVKDLFPGQDDGISTQDSFIEYNQQVFFRVTDNDSASELWKSDGSLAGTVLVKDIDSGTGYTYPRPSDGVVLNNSLYFPVSATNKGQIWKTNGIKRGTFPIISHNRYTYNLTVFDNHIFFSTAYSDPGDETGKAFNLWVSDGSVGNLTKLAQIPGQLEKLIEMDGVLYVLVNPRVVKNIGEEENEIFGESALYKIETR